MRLGNYDNQITPVDRRTAMQEFVEFESISMSFRDKMNRKLRWFIVRYFYIKVRYMVSLDAALRHVTRIFLDNLNVR